MALSNLSGWNKMAASGDFYDADPQCWKEVPGYEGSRS